MRKKRNGIKSFAQRLYITWDTFLANDLFTYASAGAYSFLLSAFPIVLMVLAILIRIFNTSPDVIQDLLGSSEMISRTLNLVSFLDSVMSMKSVGIFEAIIGVSVFWMARRLFASIQQGIKAIYRMRAKAKPIKENLVLIAGEVLLVILIVVTTIAIIAGNAIFQSALPEDILSPYLFSLFRNLFRFAPFGIIFFFLFLVYFVTPNIRPSARQSLFSSAACTVSFAIVQFAFRSFVNMARYNLVYGILSNMIVFVLEVYLFFVLFLFYAQYLYVEQYFESYLLAELYLMPDYRDKDPLRQVERILFIAPPLFYRRYAIKMSAGETVFAIGDGSTELYYVWNGFVRLEMPEQVIVMGRGRVFGEFSSIIGGLRTATAVAETDITLLRIPAYLFQEAIEVDAEMSRRTLQMIADYVRKNNSVPLSTN